MALDTSKYESGRRKVNDEWGAKRAANEFGRFTSQQRFSRDIGDFKQNFGDQQGGFMGAQARRGLTGGGVNSGSFQQALQKRATGFTQNLGRMQQDAASQQQQYQMDAGNIDRWRGEALADIEASKQRDIAMAALQLQSLRPLFT